MDHNTHFGQWLRQRRRELDLTQEQLADCVGCSYATIRKIEGDERRPSRQVAELLLECLQVPPGERPAFLQLARRGLQSQGAPSPNPPANERLASEKPGISTNLPSILTPPLGREQEAASIRERVLRPDLRLLTLTGPGGVGKTLLGMRVAWDLLADFRDGVYFVALAHVGDPGLVAPTIAYALGLKDTGGDQALSALAGYLRGKSILLFLDNFEQVVSAAAVLAELLAANPHLKILVTSREALHVSGERQYPVPPLALPDLARLPVSGDSAGGIARAVAGYPAVELFVERATATLPDFALSEENAGAVVALCARLDGLPLAIELAAARIKVLTPQAMLARLEGNLRLLTGGPRDAPARHQTLRDAIRWSYDLLEGGEQILFRRLGVFVDGCSLSVVEAVCNAHADLPVDTLEGLQSLLDKSLLRQETGARGDLEGADGALRFTMLETIREYARERLEETPEAEVVYRVHAEHYLALLEVAEPLWGGVGADQKEWLDRLEAAHSNIQAALSWALRSGDVSLAAGMVLKLWRFWEVRGYIGRGRLWIRQILARSESLPVAPQARILLAASRLAWLQGDAEESGRFAAQCLTLSSEVGDRRGVAQSLHTLAIIDESTGNYERAEARYGESLAVWRALGDKGNMARLTNSMGVVARMQEDYGRAAALFGECLRMHRELGSPARSIALALANLGQVALAEGDYKRAAGLYAESLELRQELGHKVGIADCLVGFAAVAGSMGQFTNAVKLFGAAEALYEAAGYSIEPSDRPIYEAGLTLARGPLESADFAAAWAEGRALPQEEAVAMARAVTGNPWWVP